MMAHRKTTLAYGVTDDPRHKYALEDSVTFPEIITRHVLFVVGNVT